MERKDLGSWLEGPPQLNTQQWPGQRLGRPERGPGSIARFPRRVGAIIIDWALAMLVSWWLFDSAALATLLLFCLGQIITVGFTGHSIGHRALGMQVQSMDGTAIKPLTGLVRSVLLCLVIPALIADADQRGLHDRAGGSVLVSIR
ncbi:RDD family protein [Glutamicibacter creatinolyticus]|uniref:RDD family protein n=1 Tax=Micrococcaceae TaxID=1268 RepID=UPI0006CFE2D6|nr:MULTISPECIES: RDD family protein [Micrococcaceae]TLK49867.1 RDD family protein [Glutamicibacter sp. V16R2B1]